MNIVNKYILYIKRTNYVCNGGRKINYIVFTIIRHNGLCGIGKGKAVNILSSMEKSYRNAVSNLIYIRINNGTILSNVCYKVCKTIVCLFPMYVCSGIVAGGYVRIIIKWFNIINIYGVIKGSKNKENVIYATFNAFKILSRNNEQR